MKTLKEITDLIQEIDYLLDLQLIGQVFTVTTSNSEYQIKGLNKEDAIAHSFQSYRKINSVKDMYLVSSKKGATLVSISSLKGR